MAHRLDPLLRPASIAVVGASRRPESVGNTVIRNLLAGGFSGSLYAVNPNYADVEGVSCYSSLDALPGPVEQVIFTVGDRQIENAVQDAIGYGARSCVIYSALVLEADTPPPLRERVAGLLAAARMPVCGGNAMGFYNFRDGIRACGFDTRSHRPPGNIALISQSGAGMSAILDVDDRLDFNFAVSTGQELSVTMEDYLDWALDQPETRVVGLVLETCRRPAAFIEALEKARARSIPVVAVKLGRTELAARLAESHSGAMAGSDTVYDAVFERHGVQRVDDLDELATALILFAQPHPVACGGLVSLHDSGGERQLLIDLADTAGVPLAQLSSTSERTLATLLDPGLPPVNPLDAWGDGGPDYHHTMENCFAALMADDDAALGAVIHARGPRGKIHPVYGDYLRAGHRASGKPAFLVAARQGTGSDALATDLTREGFPVLDGVRPFLSGVRCLLGYRDFLARAAPAAPRINAAITGDWHGRLRGRDHVGEAEAMNFLSACGVPTVKCFAVDSESGLQRAAAELDFPVVLKTANPEVRHKTDQGGVILGIGDRTALLDSYRGLAARLGPEVSVAPMIRAPGLEMILGMSTDPQFGPVVVMGIGGTLAELIQDSVTVLPPFDAGTARRLLNQLASRAVLDGVRGAPALDVEAYCRTAALFSDLAVNFRDAIRELDLNPVLVLERGCLVLDALIVPHSPVPAATARCAGERA